MTPSGPDHSPQASADAPPRERHLCPVWIGYLLLSPLRRLVESPETILGPLVRPGMTVVDLGSAMGFFSLPLARMVGPTGRVVCVDVQPRMLATLERRARRRGLDGVVETHLATHDALGLEALRGKVDLALAAHVAHETASPRRFLSEVRELLRPGGTLVVLEPRGHVTAADFDATRRLALETGFAERPPHTRPRSHIVVLERTQQE